LLYIRHCFLRELNSSFSSVMYSFCEDESFEKCRKEAYEPGDELDDETSLSDPTICDW